MLQPCSTLLCVVGFFTNAIAVLTRTNSVGETEADMCVGFTGIVAVKYPQFPQR